MMTTTTFNTATGCLFDIYHIKDKMILWIKENDGNAKRLEYPWSPSICVVSDEKSQLVQLLNNDKILSFTKEYEFVYSFEYPSDTSKREVLKLTVNDSFLLVDLAKKIESLSEHFGNYRLYNVDIPIEHPFLFEKDIYPLGFYTATKGKLPIILMKSHR